MLSTWFSRGAKSVRSWTWFLGMRGAVGAQKRRKFWRKTGRKKNNLFRQELRIKRPTATNLLKIYDTHLLRNPQWVNSVWYDPAKDRWGPALASDPRDVNRKIPSPQTFSNNSTTSTIDLSGLREL